MPRFPRDIYRFARQILTPDMKKSASSPIVARSGRFASGPSLDVASFSESVSFDWRLWSHDIRGSKAHAMMLAKIGVLTAKEKKAILAGLDAIAADIAAGNFTWNSDLEDVHMNIEAELTRRVPAGAKLHTARSRNDQVALDMRLWLRDEIDALAIEIRKLQLSLVNLGGRHPDTCFPGYTHMQRGQPVFVAHHLLAYVEMLDRDFDRLLDAYHRTNVCPLGSGALAGSTLPINREYVARILEFVDHEGSPRLSQNSMDAVSDRDFVLEFCSTAALLAVHLSRLAEDVILWATTEFRFIRIADAYTTGSSLMPQKKNPDIAELTRGKSGRVIGNLVSLLTLLKGLPMTYNRDLQEDKERMFDTADTVRATVRLMSAMLDHTSFNDAVCNQAASDPLLLATDLADALVARGIPFRQAHHLVGEAVALSESSGIPLDQLPIKDLIKISDAFEASMLEVFQLKRAMDNRRVTGSPGTLEVKKQLKRWKKDLKFWQKD